uniref:Phosphoglucomutase (alpha-D-glucose-1,6-bisphosphate-dependent) n=1 Tax=Meloidogyne incognita TaxID=6306 RepID=A0A914N3W4_MELIC
MDEELQKLIKNWFEWDKNEDTRSQIQKLVDTSNLVELKALMIGELSFGTAGVRTKMGPGFTQLNDLTIIQLSHGMAQHLLQDMASKGNNKIPKIVVGFDGRHNSLRFAQLASNVFIKNRICVTLFSECVPTPVVSFAVVELNCDAGLMITASHNPKEYNGYKVYWNNGAQILSPHDKKICLLARESPPKEEYWNITTLNTTNNLFSVADSVLEKYFCNESAVCCFYRELNAKTSLKFTYSAFHGVGSKFARRMFKEFGFTEDAFSYVKEQDEPNPDFPTVSFPNPEEGHAVLKLCYQTAEETGATLILANDPDADRLQIAERQPDEDWHLFNGNEMGTLLTWWIWTQWKQKNLNIPAEDVYILNSAVSSQIVATMAKIEGFKNDVSLTGFKWIGNLAHEIRKKGRLVILAWEESIGFATGTTLDKDGVSAAAVFAEMANYLTSQKLNMKKQLFNIYNKYGFHLIRNSYWTVPENSVTKKLFNNLRENGKYPVNIDGNNCEEKYVVKHVRDLNTGFDSSQPNNKAILPLSTTSDMITFTLASGSLVTLRASGTEPKIKYYIELQTEPGKTENDLEQVENELNQLENNVVQTLLQPEKYGLISR